MVSALACCAQGYYQEAWQAGRDGECKHAAIKRAHKDLTHGCCAQGYYQEAGRAGRDGEQSECILLWARRDIARFIKMNRQKPKAARERAQRSLEEVCTRNHRRFPEVSGLNVLSPSYTDLGGV